LKKTVSETRTGKSGRSIKPCVGVEGIMKHVHIAERCIHGEEKQRLCDHQLEWSKWRVREVPCKETACGAGRNKKMAVRKVAKKSPVKKANGVKKTAPAKVVQVRVQFDIMVSVGEADERSFEEFRDDAVTALKENVGAKNVTTLSGYYLVNGRVCLPGDYDPKTRGFKPGARPPLWAMSADESKIAQRIEREKKLPEIARQPANLRTSKETDEYHALLKKDPEAAKEHRRNETKKVLDDLRENTDWGKRQSEIEDIEDEDDIEDVEEFEDDEAEEEVEEIEDEWDEEDDVFDEETADDVVTTSSVSVLARLRAAKAKKSR